MGGRGGSSGAKISDKQMQKEMDEHFSEINKKINDFMSAKGYARSSDYIPGTYLEKDSLEEMKKLLKDYNRGFNEITDDDSIAIMYKSGDVVFGEDILNEGKNIKLSNIDSVIFDNGSTTVIAGKNVEVYNVRERLPYKEKGYNSYRSVEQRYNDEDDIRADFKYKKQR